MITSKSELLRQMRSIKVRLSPMESVDRMARTLEMELLRKKLRQKWDVFKFWVWWHNIESVGGFTFEKALKSCLEISVNPRTDLRTRHAKKAADEWVRFWK
jgi:hypothetical protein